jgi:hypothetical protein
MYGTGVASEQLRLITQEYNVKYNLLFQLMQSSKLQSSRRAPSLRQLILRLNFNGFSEREAMQQMS